MMYKFICNYMSKIVPVAFRLIYDGHETKVGEGESQFTITLNKPLQKNELLTSTSIALGEAYMRKDLELDQDLYTVLDLILGHMGKFTTNKSKLKSILYTSNSKKNQRKEVSSHYDIGNDFYKLWLDDSLSYSCAYFKTEEETLHQAQMNKIHHILKKLRLEEGMTLLDIGCGWGSLLIEAAKTYKVKGVGITLSTEQQAEFQKKIEAEGLQNQLEVKILDYRDLENSSMEFDRIVSVGMIEHVGRENYNLFMKNAHTVLKDKGLFLLHSITALEEYPGDAWIKKYIFPGGVVPSLRELINIFPKYRFYTLDIESLRLHYNRTLLHWLKNFTEKREVILDMMGDEFTRMWELYLASCAATFHNGIIDLHQILLSREPNNNLPFQRVV